MSETMDALGEYLTADLPEFTPDAPPPAIADLDQAGRHMRRIAMLDRILAEKEAHAKAEIDKIDAWLHMVSVPLLNERNWRKAAIEQWARAECARGGGKTQKLPSGTVSLRAPRPSVEFLGEPDELVPERFRRETWVSKSDLAAATQVGPEIERADTPPGSRAHLAVDADGVAVPNVIYLVPVEDTCKVTVKP